MTLLVLMLAGCGWFGGPSSFDEPPGGGAVAPSPVHAPTAIALATRRPLADPVVPPSNRPLRSVAPMRFGLVAPFERHESTGEVDVFRTPLPVHSNLLPTRLRGTHTFGSAPPPGLTVQLGTAYVPFERGGRAAGSYGFTREHLLIGVPAGQPAPDWTTVQMRFDRATDAENQLNFATSGQETLEFVQRSITLDERSMQGLYLPAPSHIQWDVRVPDNAVLRFDAHLLPAAIRTGSVSDGATIVVEVLSGDSVLQTESLHLEPGPPSLRRVDLSAHGGTQRILRIRTEPGETDVLDYVFLAAPALYTPSDDPKRVVLVFVDTLRPDHLGLYGHHRATSPAIDRWAAHAAVFTDARSVAPWTLPSARSVLTGHQPEQWYEVANLPEQFADAGFHTEAVVANAFLSQPFDMHRGWAGFNYQHLLPADGVADLGLEALAANPDRDLLLMLHFMDAHLPYEEPLLYRFRWAGPSPMSHDPMRARLYDMDPESPELPLIADYMRARYDQNIRFIDDELARVLDAVGRDATTVLFSDHGEEFWEHGNFEHGHAFWDEVLRVPLIIRSPHITPGTYDQPVSLLDVTPTVLDLAGLEESSGPGRSLVPVTQGDARTAQDLQSRPQAFGRPLYEQDGWAVLAQGHKWVDRAGVQRLYNLSEDPSETVNIAGDQPLTDYPDLLSSALDRDVVQVWRIRPKVGRTTNGRVQITLTHPDGIAEAWASYDPRGRTADTVLTVTEQGLVVNRPSGVEMPNAIFVRPNSASTPAGLMVEMTGDAGDPLQATALVERLPPGPERRILAEAGGKGWGIVVDAAWVPVRQGVEVAGFHEDVQNQLRELGYLDE